MNDQIQNMTTFDKGTYQTLLTSDEKFIDTITITPIIRPSPHFHG